MSLSEAQPHPPRRPSDQGPRDLPALSETQRAPMPVVFSWEHLSDVLTEIAPLIRRHWQEVDWFDGQLPLDPDWKQALQLDQAGVLHLLTARIDGLLVGYIWSYILPSVYFSLPWATVQGFWVDPVQRAGWLGIKLFKENERGLVERGAKAISIEILMKIASNRGTLGKIVERLGYRHLGNLYAKVL